VNGIAQHELEVQLRSMIAGAPADAVVTIRVEGAINEETSRLLSAAYLRSIAPSTMNIELRPTDWSA
jgi:hypothetical protein